MKDWEIEALKLKKEGIPLKEIMKLHNPLGLGYETFQRRLWRVSHPGDKKIQEETNPNLKKPISLLELLKTQSDINTLMDKTNKSKRVIEAEIEDLKEQGYNILTNGELYSLYKGVIDGENLHTEEWEGNQIIKFGIVSDTHLCSLWQQLTHLNDMYDIFQKQGIETVYHTGDITEGVNMRKGHEYEVFKHGVDEQSQYVIDEYPKREGIVTKFITGNHDHSGIKSAGYDIGVTIAREREDMIYLGRSNAKINLTPNCILQLNHPLDGASYATSYALQKFIDSLSGGEKPNILFNGHHHKQLGMFYRNIHAFESGTFQAQTPWMMGKRLAANMGGYIMELSVDNEGTIKSCTSTFIPYYKEVKNDY